MLNLSGDFFFPPIIIQLLSLRATLRILFGRKLATTTAMLLFSESVFVCYNLLALHQLLAINILVPTFHLRFIITLSLLTCLLVVLSAELCIILKTSYDVFLKTRSFIGLGLLAFFSSSSSFFFLHYLPCFVYVMQTGGT